MSNSQKRRRYEDYKQNFENFENPQRDSTKKSGASDREYYAPRNYSNDRMGNEAKRYLEESIGDKAIEDIHAAEVFDPHRYGGVDGVPGVLQNSVHVKYKNIFTVQTTYASGADKSLLALYFQADLSSFLTTAIVDPDGKFVFDSQTNTQTVQNLADWQKAYSLFAVGGLRYKVIPAGDVLERKGDITHFNLAAADLKIGGDGKVNPVDLKNSYYAEVYSATKTTMSNMIPLDVSCYDMRDTVIEYDGVSPYLPPKSSTLDVSSTRVIAWMNKVDNATWSDTQLNGVLTESGPPGWTRPGFMIEMAGNNVTEFTVEVEASFYLYPRLSTYDPTSGITPKSDKKNFNADPGSVVSKVHKAIDKGEGITNKAKKAVDSGAKTAMNVLGTLESIAEVAGPVMAALA